MANDITMPRELRRELERSATTDIPQEYSDAGYHFCYDWDFLIVGPPDPEWEGCHCKVKDQYLEKRK